MLPRPPGWAGPGGRMLLPPPRRRQRGPGCLCLVLLLLLVLVSLLPLTSHPDSGRLGLLLPLGLREAGIFFLGESRAENEARSPPTQPITRGASRLGGAARQRTTIRATAHSQHPEWAAQTTGDCPAGSRRSLKVTKELQSAGHTGIF